MKKSKSNIEGFVLRRPGAQLGALHGKDIHTDVANNNHYASRPVFTEASERSVELGKAQAGRAIGRSDIDESLNQIDVGEPTKKLTRKQQRRLNKMSKRPRGKHKVLKRLLIFAGVVIIALGGFITYRFIDFGGRVLQGNILDIFQTEPLKQDSNGRSNFLILGTSEDDPGHPGGMLTDSILVLSLDQKNKNAYMFSVPRDLKVQYGTLCSPGYSGLINAYFNECVNTGKTKEDEQDRLIKTQKFVGDIVGMDIQYGIHVNYTVMRDVVNAIGGSITITIESRDPKGQMDSNFDWKCGTTLSKRLKKCPPHGHYIDYQNGPVTLDAEHALYLAQARGDVSPTYGFEKSNFDREKNQQKILIAIRDKALSTGTLTNLGSVSNLISALGNNLRTDINTSEVRTLVNLASQIKSGDIHTISLIDGDNPVMKGDGNPSAGLYSYSAIQAFIAKSMIPPDVASEAAPLAVFNGSGQTGLAQTEANKLTAAGFTVSQVDTAPAGKYAVVEVYQIGTGNPATAAKLTSTYGVTIKTTKPPVVVNDNVKFVVIFGPKSS